LIEIRALQADDVEAFATAMSGPFGFDLPEDAQDRTSMLERLAKTFEPERARCAFDGSRMVGTLGVQSFEMTVPGGTVPVAGTTQVTVQVTHRRRGVFGQMMRAHLSEAAEHGDVAAALWASDSAIYGRFGFGMATWNSEIEIDRRHVDFNRLAADPAPVEVVDVETVRAPAIDLYERLRTQVPGLMAYSEGWWDRILSDPPWNRGGAGRARYGLVTEDGRPTGWVKYRLKDRDEDDGHPAQDVIVAQLYADTASAWSGLWTHVLSHDFGHTIRAGLRPVDDPIHALLRAPRRAATKVTDGMWIRILDVPRALEARTYSLSGRIGLTVRDPLGLVTGTYVLETDGASSLVTTAANGDVELDVEDLGALLLGGRSAVQLALAGRLAGGDGAIIRLDTMFRGHRAPWSPVIF
jgi:predicted acetyltransferase